MAKIHHASWHLLRKHKQKTRTRHYSKARIGNLERRFEEAQERAMAILQRPKVVVGAMTKESGHG
ncbi:MAG: hypothetical protein HYX43_16315 [Burkholderiales bacterium]|nr:hypothetical protein [Burkholderiales bacterium]